MKDTPDPASEVAKQLVPLVYKDVVQPAAKEAGKTLGDMVRIALSPANLAVWTFDQAVGWAHRRVEQLLQHAPIERIQNPAPAIAVPALAGLQLVGSDPDLRELFANLLATAVDRETAHEAHPAFIEVIRQLAPEEARFLRWFGLGRSTPLFWRDGQGRPVAELIQKGDKYERDQITAALTELGRAAALTVPELTPTYVENLTRLGIMLVRDVLGEEQTVDRVLRLELTTFGEMFSRTCVIQHPFLPDVP